MLSFARVICVLFGLLRWACGAFDLSYKNDDSDLTFFHTRPEIRAPILDVTVHDKQATVPGYFFVAPYAKINQAPQAPLYYQACQTGPAIYDADGELVWSGACLGRNQNACDFRSTSIGGSDYLSAVMYAYADVDTLGHGMILDSSYQKVGRVKPPHLDTGMNMHEFKLLPSPRGMSAIHVTNLISNEDYRSLNTSTVNKLNATRGTIIDTGFQEVDVDSGDVLFRWQPKDHIPLTQSTMTMDGKGEGRHPTLWNWFHANSVEKNADGDFLFNSRYTNSMYKVSGSDQSVLWQLGGDNSSFFMDGFNFSRQHDARWISCNSTVEVISFFDNGGDGVYNTANTSSALIIALHKDTEPPAARILSRVWRPDGLVSKLRGNYQTFPDSRNTFVGWSGDSYMTEHAEDGRLLLEARFRSKRFVTYRSYKFPFKGTPADELPALKALVFGISEGTATTVAYVSWNGATEVDSWIFYTNATEPIRIGSQRKTGFETMFQTQGYHDELFVEAVDKHGITIGRSDVESISRPLSWVNGTLHPDLEDAVRAEEHGENQALVEEGVEKLGLLLVTREAEKEQEAGRKAQSQQVDQAISPDGEFGTRSEL